MTIPFTQYLRPDGRTRPITIDRPAEIETVALRLAEKGVRFESEVLRTLEISLEAVVERDGETVSLAQEIIPNGPGVPEAVDRLVLAAERSLSS